MASARVFFSKHRKYRNGFISDEVPVVENGYDVHDSDEDEVFVQDPHLEISASKPLMHPRNKGQRTKVTNRTLECRLCGVCKPIFYFLALVSVLCAVMATIVYIANRHQNQSNAGAVYQGQESNKGLTEKPILKGCDNIEVEDVWVAGFPKLLTESAFRLVDINKDGIMDIVFGFSTGADGYGVKDIVCDIYFQGRKPCSGGVMALEGATGTEMWRLYTRHEIYGLNCQYDINKDGVNDCLAAGRAATFVAINGKDGSMLWKLQDHKALNPVMNMYTPQYISDSDGDNIADIIIVHGGDPLQDAGSPFRLSGRILVVSGRTGVVLKWVGVPDHRESYYSPQLLMRQDGSQLLLFGTGGETHNGSLWSLDVTSLLKGKTEMAFKLSSDTHKGFMTPPALADITRDGVEDIVIPMYNSTLLAIDGDSFLPLWSVRFPSSETYSTPAVGFYNDDDIPDFMVKYEHGPGFPVYYYSETTVIDGKTGKKLVDPPLRDTIGAQASPLTISMEGFGNDVFLVWMAECKGHEGSTEEFSFVKGTSSSDKSWSNLCRLRFNTEGYSRLLAISRQHSQAGVTIYNSAERKKVEHSKWINTSAEAYEYIMRHPGIINGFTSGMKSSSENSEVRAMEDVYNQPQYLTDHRIGSKKGPDVDLRSRTKEISPGRDSNLHGYKQRFNDVSSQYFPKGDNNNLGYNKGSEFNHAYLPSNQAPTPEGYGLPYRQETANSFPGASYGPVYGNEDSGYSYYRPEYPFNYRSANKRNMHKMFTSKKKKFSTRRKRLAVIRRHVGAHDDEGLQRLISTGTLAPSSLPSSHADFNQTIDVIFATYWVFPARTKAILPADQKCIAKKMSEEGVVRYDPQSPYYQMNHDEYEESITGECLKLSDHQLPESGTYSNSEDVYNPFNLNMGQMTVYRLRLKFSCSPAKNATEENTKCASVLPFNQQKWAAYMGSNGDGHWSPPSL